MKPKAPARSTRDLLGDADRQIKAARNLETGAAMIARRQATEEIVAATTRSSDADVLALSAWSGVRAARRALRDAAIRHAERGDWQSAVDTDSAWEALERSARRAERFGGDAGPYGARTGRSFWPDVFLREVRHDPAAADRLDELADAIEIRAGLDLGSSFVAPGFETAEYADIPRQEQVFAALIPQLPLPKGSTLEIPRFSASGFVGPTAQNTAPPEVDLIDQFLTRPVGWVAGLFDVSLQLIEQSWKPAFDQVASEVLITAANETLESQCFTGSGTGGEMLGLLAAANLTTVTYTDTTPTASKMLVVLGEALAQYAADRKKTATAILMTPLRWAWLAGGQDAQQRPLLNLAGPPAEAPGGTAPVGAIGGVPVYTTSGIPTNLGAGTNQDQIVITRPEDHRLYLSQPTYGAYLDSATLAGQLSAVLTYSQSAALFADRYPSVAVAGTGLVAPAGY